MIPGEMVEAQRWEALHREERCGKACPICRQMDELERDWEVRREKLEKEERGLRECEYPDWMEETG